MKDGGQVMASLVAASMHWMVFWSQRSSKRDYCGSRPSDGRTGHASTLPCRDQPRRRDYRQQRLAATRGDRGQDVARLRLPGGDGLDQGGELALVGTEQARDLGRRRGVGIRGYAVAPPSMTKLDPVMKPASSDARNTTAAAMSAGTATRLIGSDAAIACRDVSTTAESSVPALRYYAAISVSTAWGCTELTRMRYPLCPNSIAIDFVNVVMPPLVIE